MSTTNSTSPLAGAELVGFLATTDLVRCRAFFVDQLGFRVLAEDPMALTLDAVGRTIRIQKLREHRPQQFTVLGWNVADLDAVVTKLVAAGVRPQHYGFSVQDARGIATFEGGTRLVWLHDPDGNVLSIAQMAAR